MAYGRHVPVEIVELTDTHLPAVVRLCETALDLAEDAAEAAQISEISPAIQCSALALQAQVRIARGRAGDALRPAAEAMERLEQIGGLEEGESLVRLTLAESLHASGDLAGARLDGALDDPGAPVADLAAAAGLD